MTEEQIIENIILEITKSFSGEQSTKVLNEHTSMANDWDGKIEE